MTKKPAPHLKYVHALGRLDRHLSAAQNELANISNMETRESSPTLHAFGGKAYEELEKMRRTAQSNQMNDAALRAHWRAKK